MDILVVIGMVRNGDAVLPCARSAVWPGAWRRYNNCWRCGYAVDQNWLNDTMPDRYMYGKYHFSLPFIRTMNK
ncbi:hypothetical protein H3H36_18085 [Duganella sp. FT3S]|uniref:Uncharacterized protein n=1 Tax=Rugamonas fusca TaxID=2758568 RepID=A0A7W2EK88_9BURK|nr:hypothetical protein [Rugamonas fusca]MBA5607270.1 hypothetical protein [Rugamonas fusca]